MIGTLCPAEAALEISPSHFPTSVSDITTLAPTASESLPIYLCIHPSNSVSFLIYASLINTCINGIHPFIHSFIHSSAHSPTFPSIHPLIHLSIYFPPSNSTHLPVYLPIHLTILERLEDQASKNLSISPTVPFLSSSLVFLSPFWPCQPYIYILSQQATFSSPKVLIFSLLRLMACTHFPQAEKLLTLWSALPLSLSLSLTVAALKGFPYCTRLPPKNYKIYCLS